MYIVQNRTFLRWGITLLIALGLTAGIWPRFGQAMEMPMPSEGLACTTSSSPYPTFTLTATDGYIRLSDGNVIYMWGYAGEHGFQYPGPVLCVNQGDVVTVVLHNELPEDVSIVFLGQVGVLSNGAPSQPVVDGSGTVVSLTQPAAANGGSVTYSFVAQEPGTYLYHSGTNPSKQVQMGLAGALIVRPSLGVNYAYNSADSEFDPSTEFLLFLSEVDPLMHAAIEQGASFDMRNYRPRYFLINGRNFPDTLAPNFISRLPSQPYGALARIHEWDGVSPPVLVRYLSVGTTDYPFHPHGNSGRIIARDGRLLKGGAGQDLSYEKFTVNVGPGQTVDALFTWRDAERWDPVSNPVPVAIPAQQDLVWGMFSSGSPYLGVKSLPPDFASHNECGEYYLIAHNHALQQIVAWDLPMLGQITYIRVDPPEPNTCMGH